MANSDSLTPPLPSPAPLAPRKENVTPIGSKIAELNESRTELFNRIQGLKQDLQGWRTKLDTQVTIYREELTQLKKSLNTEVEQLRSEFQELRTNLQQQQEDVTVSLKNMGLQDTTGVAKEVQESKVEVKNEAHVSTEEEHEKVAEN
ncbi:uncharacterized protein LOC126666708 [Mercurialis annua]|uniref:uncharacterized protein LOC126666708 n=1 Tax=Mercurialis annua TaxID=3986 RepID=UPI0021608909|nr:uncharacterized protein LOC126666708 [Mercurialis annua]